MKNRMIIIAVGALMVCMLPLVSHAQNFRSNVDNNAIQSQQLMPAGTNYNGTIYEPFTNIPPSEQSGVGASYSPANAPTGPRRATGNNQDPGHTEDETSPLGDGVLPMLIMALAFGGAVYLQRRREA